MPILEKEPSCAPDDLFERLQGEPGGGKWFVIRTKPRMEKTLARELYAAGSPFYLPLFEERKIYQRRVVIVYLPLFSGYMFGYGDEETRDRVVRRREVASILPVDDQERLRSELCALDRLLNSGEPVTAEERLEAGMPAQITHGPLAGLSGQVIENRGGMKFVLQVQFIQQGASVEVDRAVIKAL